MICSNVGLLGANRTFLNESELPSVGWTLDTKGTLTRGEASGDGGSSSLGSEGPPASSCVPNPSSVEKQRLVQRAEVLSFRASGLSREWSPRILGDRRKHFVLPGSTACCYGRGRGRGRAA
ncbi:hypothetical protein Nepgr_015711 [Nepenthes gracilis]|uniref:Uncharacterized protein n=1 Tax=Nepenthes gracilis TaxID=150966 RepID=A0AAD3SNB9_NEPGR|nr:hypothetical protein Nepgr_015711 [Nepenthes gracilis]